MGGVAIGCSFPKMGMAGRLSCEGVIDNVCLYIKNGYRMPSLSGKKVIQIRLVQAGGDTRDLPPGEPY